MLLSHLVMDLTMVVSLSEREGCWLVSLGTLEILYVPTILSYPKGPLWGRTPLGKDPFGVASLYKLLSHLVMDLTLVVSLSEREACWLVSLGTLEILYVPPALHLSGDPVFNVSL